jgi:hypothetical protein
MNAKERLEKQLTRCRELLKVYQSLGGAGAFGALMITQKLE